MTSRKKTGLQKPGQVNTMTFKLAISKGRILASLVRKIQISLPSTHPGWLAAQSPSATAASSSSLSGFHITEPDLLVSRFTSPHTDVSPFN